MTQAVQAESTEVSGDLYAEVRTFYARQMRRVDSLDIEGFADTFTDDGVVLHANGARAEGRAQMVAGMYKNLPRYRDVAVRHWFDHLLIEPEPDSGGNTLRVSYYSLVTLVDAQGAITFEPTFTVEDVLVRRDGRLLTAERIIHRDLPVVF
ncbi:nuclear transport factor 2 family protein [Streptacidiphilus cavernicola]|uniref:Nuclear transport factor 2 family protein n=1 Tax=Streptacidiphilus cavernicola TaxID=3342716 RepID=A0ABV6VR25_9ACTN